MKKYVLRAPCQINGAVLPAHTVIEMPDDWKVPTRLVHDGKLGSSHDNPASMKDEPLAVEIK